ncbi:hypothetical protein TNIN_144761 [Trichonephila inaurata madagascariensis]|uniref:Uncharacterized protein n=1 Tax=Trichonephila inaurata madagascariensis TaxID=2747483 RepID=A0A8X6Y6V3_9ARAC|nr:hypothetical protein TNIN_144761 [Trichonephila inaurata madagascariensis]
MSRDAFVTFPGKLVIPCRERTPSAFYLLVRRIFRCSRTEIYYACLQIVNDVAIPLNDVPHVKMSHVFWCRIENCGLYTLKGSCVIVLTDTSSRFLVIMRCSNKIADISFHSDVLG